MLVLPLGLAVYVIRLDNYIDSKEKKAVVPSRHNTNRSSGTHCVVDSLCSGTHLVVGLIV